MPQMMPSPWLFIFFLIFICFYSVFLIIFYYFLDFSIFSKVIKSNTVFYYW